MNDDPFKTLRHLERQFALYRDPLRSVAQELADRMQVYVAPMTAALQLTKHLDDMRQLQERMAPLHALARMKVKDVFPELTALESTLRPAVSLGLDAATITRINGDMETWRRGIADVATQLTPHILGWASSVRLIVDAVERTELGDALVARMFQPTTMLTEFSRSTAKKIAKSANEAERTRLGATVAIVESQVLGHLTEVSSFISSRTIADEDDFAPDRPLRLARREQVEMVAAVAASDDAEVLIAASHAAQAHTLARRLLDLLIEINEAARLRGSDDVFKLTNRFAQGLLSLPWIDASNLPTMGVLVDDLYFLIYEAAGKDKLRFLKEHGGSLDRDDCEPVFLLKHLRNKWLRHDLEHGSDGEIRRSYRQLRDRFREYGLDGYPRRAADFRSLQRQLLEQLREFLERVLVSISA